MEPPMALVERVFVSMHSPAPRRHRRNARSPPSAAPQILDALLQGVRGDGRFLLETRAAIFAFERFEGKAVAEIGLGETRVIGIVTAAVVEPAPERPTEGSLSFNVHLGALASPAFEAGRGRSRAAELARLLERQIRDARAIDVEALCIAPGERVWQLRCDVHVLDDQGNLVDAVALAAIGALLHFRRADVSVQGREVTVHSYTERAPVPLAIHHIPLCVTFGLFADVPQQLGELSLAHADAARRPASEGGETGGARLLAALDPASQGRIASLGLADVIVADPTLREEAAADGRATFVVNAHRELCGVHKLGGCPLALPVLVRCAELAGDVAVARIAQLRAALVAADAKAAEQARRKHSAAAGYGVEGAVVGGRGGKALLADWAASTTAGPPAVELDWARGAPAAAAVGAEG